MYIFMGKKNCNKLGGISYSLSKNYEPYFSNIDELRENEHFKETEFGFSTNPSKIRFTNDSLTTFSILSGDMIPNGMKCIINFNNFNNLNY